MSETLIQEGTQGRLHRGGHRTQGRAACPQLLTQTPLHDSQDQQTPSTHHKTIQIPGMVRRRNPQLWGWVLGCRSYKGEAVPRILGGLGSALTSVTSLSTTPSLSPRRLHSGEHHPDGRGWPDPAGPRDSALPASTRPWRNPRRGQELSTEAKGHHPEWLSLGNDPIGPAGSGRESAVMGELPAETMEGETGCGCRGRTGESPCRALPLLHRGALLLHRCLSLTACPLSPGT